MLEADETHPPRPDWPILRHLTYTEAHAFELGVYLGVVVGWGITIGQVGVAFGLVVYAVHRLMQRGQYASHDHPRSNKIGFRDAVDETPYFGGGALLAALVFLGVTYLPL